MMMLRRRPSVLVHVARFFDDEGRLGGPFYYFVKITNRSRRPILVTHAWVDWQMGTPNIPILDRLPAYLREGEQREIWIQAEEVWDRYHPNRTELQRPLGLFHVRLGDGRAIRSKPNPDVPDVGRVGG